MIPTPLRSTPDPRDDASEKRFPEGFTLAAAAVLGAVIVLATALLWGRLTGPDGTLQATDDPGQRATRPAPTSSTTPSPTRPPSSSVPPSRGPSASTTSPRNQIQPVACPAAVEPVVCEAVKFVQLARGRPFKTFPTVELLDDAAFDQALLADFEQYRDDLDADGVTLTALGLLDPRTPLVDAYRDALELGVVGFYDPTSERLVVRGGELSLYAQATLVYELTHAFDDQWFDLDRDDFLDDDAEYGFTAVVEGNARRVEDQWRAELDPSRQSQLQVEEFSALSAQDLLRYLSLPPILQQLQLSPYTEGASYVGQLASAGGEASVDQALTAPPQSSEEILHPETGRTADPEVIVAQPLAGGTAVNQGRLGEVTIGFWLGGTAAAGWGGDNYVAWRDGRDRSCIAVDLAADSPADLDQIDAAARSWVASQPGVRTAERATLDGVSLIRATGCAG